MAFILFVFQSFRIKLFLASQWAFRYMHAEEKHPQSPKRKRFLHTAMVIHSRVASVELGPQANDRSCSACFVLEMIYERVPSAHKLSPEFQAGHAARTCLADNYDQRSTNAFTHHVSSLSARTSHDFNVIFTRLQCACVHTNSISVLGFVLNPPPPSNPNPSFEVHYAYNKQKKAIH